MDAQLPGRPEFTLLIDEDCPLCAREAALLRRLDRGRGRLRLVNIADADFDPNTVGVTHADLMAQMTGQTSDGRLVTGVEAFRNAYRAVGFGWLLAPTAWPGFRPVCDALYTWFARHRLRLTGRGRCAPGGSCKTP